MKNIFKTLLIAILVVGSTNSCKDSELPIDSLYENVDLTGAFLRTLEFPLQLVTATNPDNNFIAATIEVQEGMGNAPATFTEVRILASTFNDQDQLEPTVDANGNEFGETLLITLPASDFTPSEGNGLPSNSFNIPVQTVIDLSPGAIFTIPTFIFVRLELELADGRIFTNTSVAATVASGNYFNSPFAYNIIFLNN